MELRVPQMLGKHFTPEPHHWPQARFLKLLSGRGGDGDMAVTARCSLGSAGFRPGCTAADLIPLTPLLHTSRNPPWVISQGRECSISTPMISWVDDRCRSLKISNHSPSVSLAFRESLPLWAVPPPPGLLCMSVYGQPG